MHNMTEWNAKTSRITGNDIAEKIHLKKSSKPEVVSFKESTNTNGAHTVGADSDNLQSGIKMNELEGKLLDMDHEHLSRRLPPPKQLQRTDSNLTIDSDLSSDLHNSPIAWEKSSGESRNQYLMNQNLIEVEACTRAARRSGMANYTSNLADIKETSFDFDKTPRSPLSESQNLKNTFDFEKVPISPLQSPKSPVTRSCSAGNFKQASQKVHSQLKRSLSTQERETYAARRKVLTKSIQEWVNSIDRSPQLEEDDDEALSFLPVGHSSKENIVTQMPHKTDSTTDLGSEGTTEESTSNKQTAGDLPSVPSEMGICDLYDGHSQYSDGEVKDSTSKGVSQLTRYSRPSHADLLMMASHYRQEHRKSPITRVQRLHHMGASQSSDVSTSSSTRSNNSLDEILYNRDDPEQILLDLGFGSKEPEIFDRIPARFYSKPSKARGMNIDQFLNNCHEQEMKSSNDLNIGGGFRSLFGILQWSRERQGKGVKKSESARKKSAANVLNMWKNKASKANTEDKIKNCASNTVEDCRTQVEEIHCAKVDVDDKSSDTESNSGSSVVVDGVVKQTPEFIVKEETSTSSDGNGVLCQEEVQDTVYNDEKTRIQDRQHCILPLPTLTDDSEGSIASKKSSSSTLGDSSSITLITKLSDKLSFEKSEDTASDSLLVTSPEIYNVKDQLRRIPGHVLGNTHQESFEFEEVSTASEMMEEERLEKQSAMKGKLSRAGSAQSDSSGFADDLVEVTVASLLSQQLDISDDMVCVHDKDVQTNSDEFLSNEEHKTDLINDTEPYNSIEKDSPFDDRYQEITPRKRPRHDTFPRTSRRVPWSADHPKSVIEILKTLKVNSGNENHVSHSKRSPLLKLKSVYADYPEELPTTSNLNSTQLPSLDSTDNVHNLSEPSSFLSMSSGVQETNSKMSSTNVNVQNCDSCLPSITSTIPQSLPSHLPSLDLSSQPSNSSFKPSINKSFQSDSPQSFTLSESNTLLKFENLECPPTGSLTLDNSGKNSPVVPTEEPINENTHTTSDISISAEEPKTAVTNFEVYLAKDSCGLSNVPSCNDNSDVSAVSSNKQIPGEKSTNGEHDKVCCKLNKMIDSVKSCYYSRPQMSDVEIKNAKQQVALQDIQLLHRAVSSYKSELVELEGLSDQIYQTVHSHLTLNERCQLGSLRTLHLQLMDEVESIEKLLLSLAKTIKNEPQVEDFSDAYRNSLDHLQVLKQMITLLREQKMLRDMLGSLEVEYRIAYGSVMQEHPVLWTSEKAELIQQLMDLKTELDQQRQTSQKQFASSLQEMKHDLLKQLRNDVLEETENLRSQLKLKETEVENLRRQLQSTCGSSSN